MLGFLVSALPTRGIFRKTLRSVLILSSAKRLWQVGQPVCCRWQRSRSGFLRQYAAMATGGQDPFSKSGRSPNRLVNEKSPYLLQHAYNPVDWYPWGPEAFEKAKREDKPIFLSVGYSTCHWCHVMEKESFENEEIGKILHDSFVAIKVDREERPDVDKVYMTFVQATSSGGGWPMSVWLTPDLKPFVGGTYFPLEDGTYHLGFKTVLKRIAEQWKHNKSAMVESSENILKVLQDAVVLGGKETNLVLPPCQEVTERCFDQLANSYDEEYGGFSVAPKFPTAVTFSFLFCYWAAHKRTEAGARALQMALHTLRMMANGGIHDHIGQGFHRYSTDALWHVPHFEKMLYDQGQLAVAYIDAYQISGDTFFADVARDILQYVSRDLSNEEGGFYSAEDADSLPTAKAEEKKEGAFCVWTSQEILQLLPDPVPGATNGATMGDIFIHYYGVKEKGNVNPAQDPHGELTGQNVLIVHYSLELTAAKYGLETDEVKKLLERCREQLYSARQMRPRPHLDSKMLASWNGLMLSGFAHAGAVLGEKNYIERATSAACFLRKHLFYFANGRLLRSCYQGELQPIEHLSVPVFGFLDDFAFVIRALLDLYEASFEQRWLEWAVQLQEKQDELFWDPKQFAYYTSDDSDPSILFRLKDDQDGAEPSANSVAASNLLRLSNFMDRKDWELKSSQILSAFSNRLCKIPVALPEMVRTLMAKHQALKQIVICGDPAEEDTQKLISCINSHYMPHKVLLLADGNKESFLYLNLPFLSTLERQNGKATAYICENHTCSLPVTSVEDLKKLLTK
ncbi:spermatogenesis-associated protein 20 isoform X2 [Protopterus annectens]|uniref:spermatogenesis-associated protein 20 isoform X2 n=1 Tax=Protopterus annectens TaxID=7888 RepID=UPI001CF9F7FF|nr:spermatogenesis-associated protein 20 isoform X2 [Protopterus annectens]